MYVLEIYSPLQTGLHDFLAETTPRSPNEVSASTTNEDSLVQIQDVAEVVAITAALSK